MAINTLNRAVEKAYRNIGWNENEIRQHHEKIAELTAKNTDFERRIIRINEAVRKLEEVGT